MITIEIPPCTTIDRACEMAADAALEKGESAQFEFNSVVVTVHPQETVEMLMDRYYGALKNNRENAVAQFHADLQVSIVRALHNQGCTFFDDVDAGKVIAAIKPFLRTP